MISLSVSEASRQLPELVRRVCAEDEEALLSENGAPVARLLPVNDRRATGQTLAQAWARHERLGDDEAAAFDADLAAARSSLPAPSDQWD